MCIEAAPVYVGTEVPVLVLEPAVPEVFEVPLAPGTPGAVVPEGELPGLLVVLVFTPPGTAVDEEDTPTGWLDGRVEGLVVLVVDAPVEEPGDVVGADVDVGTTVDEPDAVLIAVELGVEVGIVSVGEVVGLVVAGLVVSGAVVGVVVAGLVVSGAVVGVVVAGLVVSGAVVGLVVAEVALVLEATLVLEVVDVAGRDE
jgi:hypothetical protein